MRRAAALLLLAGLAGCSGDGMPCLPWDDGCATAALEAEAAIDPGWDAVAVSGVGCESAEDLLGDSLARCWEVRLRENSWPGGTAEILVVQMTNGSLITTTSITER